jgi:pimeloyl-ACP methyl ester carboxylesterase
VADMKSGTSVSTSGREHLGWIVRESGPEGSDHTVLLLPGALASSIFYDDLVSELTGSASIRFVATTLPGFGRTPPLDEVSVEEYARTAGALAADLGCNAVVGHSLGANVALEMAAAGTFEGPVVLISPSFSREDESKFPRALDRLSRVLGHLPYSLMFKLIGPAMRSSLPAHRSDELIADLQNNDPRFVRRQTRLYLEYLDRHGSLARRLCASGVRAWVVFGDGDDVGLKDSERQELESCPTVILVTIPDAGHFTLNQKPARVAEVVLQALAGPSPLSR